jgi:hypothetical protein
MTDASFTLTVPPPSVEQLFVTLTASSNITGFISTYRNAFDSSAELTDIELDLGTTQGFTLTNVGALLIRTTQPLNLTIYPTGQPSLTLQVNSMIFVDAALTSFSVANFGTVQATVQLTCTGPSSVFTNLGTPPTYTVV